ncbi:HK97 family phage prohead protease [Mycolicibacterium fortuitum]|uniref:HK97 family phage prohead protease n=1 Tax=Mycolicibacterium fortuitum TaxID=1766 RepID=UPI001131E49B|nr:HK97 family phage prohead protease [Mycolicibacterium fortuitum]TPW98034.1 HK97 family phage prohead protease [Mycolicibacterium fortuitum]
MSILFRSAELSPGSGRTIHGVVVPYGQVTEVSDGGRPYRERIDFGACDRSIRERGSKIRLFTGHETRKLPIGKAVELREHYDGLHAAFEVAATRDGDDALELVRSGTVDSFSIGFRGIRERRDGDVVVRTEIALMEVSLVGIPAYAGATVTGVRSQPLVVPRSVAQARLSLLDW